MEDRVKRRGVFGLCGNEKGPEGPFGRARGSDFLALPRFAARAELANC